MYSEYILQISRNGIDLANVMSLNWRLVLAHASTFAFIFVCLINGTKSSGKVVYVTATLPYLLITLLLINGVTLEGSLKGIQFFLHPQWSSLLDYNVWLEAFIQVVYQLGASWGSLITMSRYNDFHHKVYRDALFIPLGNALTAIYGGIALFAILGNMSFKYDVPVEEVARSGPALAYVAYPEAIAQLPWSPLWAAVFFLMLISVAIDTQLAVFETVLSGITDMFPVLQQGRYRQLATSAGMATTFFAISLPMCSQAGMYIYQILDWYAAVITFTVNGFLECIVVGFIYGIDRFYSDAALMFGSRPNKLVGILWRSATPAVMALVALVGLVNLTPPTYPYTHYTVRHIFFLILFFFLSLFKIDRNKQKKQNKKVSRLGNRIWLAHCLEFICAYSDSVLYGSL